MIDVLFVSIAFPPKNDPECIQTARYFRYLKNFNDLDIDVVTSRVPTLFMPYDQSLEKYNLPVRQKVEIPIYESKLSNYIFRLLSVNRVVFPDSKVSFSWSWRKVVREIKTKPQVIYSRSNPISSALMALKLKKHFGCKWVLHFSDPWSLSPLHSSDQRKIADQEKEFFEAADLITFTSEKTLTLYQAAYPKLIDKFKVLPNVYDPEDLCEPSFTQADKLRVVYTGGMAGLRGASFLTQVLETINRINPELISQIEFLFAGDMDGQNRFFFESTPWPCIKHIGLLPYAKVKPLHQSAHVLLVIDNPTTSDQAIYFPSKILDYFMARKLIWAVTPEGSTTRSVLKGQKHAAFNHSESDAMAHFLIACIKNLEAHNSLYFDTGTAPDFYSAKVNAELLADLIRRVVMD